MCWCDVPTSFSDVDFASVFQLSNMMGHQISISILKTLLGAWITSRRTQNSVCACIFCGELEADMLQHYCSCDKLWYTISKKFPPFTAHFDPLPLFGLAPLSPFQIYGVYLAFHLYHSGRHFSLLTNFQIDSILKSYMRGCPVHDHLIKTYFGKARSKYVLPATSPTSHTNTSSSSNANTPLGPGLSRTTSCTDFNSRTTDFPLNLRLRMPPQRRASFIARGIVFPSGPLYRNEGLGLTGGPPVPNDL